MEQSPKSKQTGDASRDQSGDLVIEPLQPERASQTVVAIERRLAALQIALATDLNLLKREIFQRLGVVEDALEVLARELARKRCAEDEEAGSANVR